MPAQPAPQPRSHNRAKRAQAPTAKLPISYRQMLEIHGIETSDAITQLRHVGIPKREAHRLVRVHGIFGNPNIPVTRWVRIPDALPSAVVVALSRPGLRTAAHVTQAIWGTQGWPADTAEAWRKALTPRLPSLVPERDPVRVCLDNATRARSWATSGRTPRQAAALEEASVHVEDFIHICQQGYHPDDAQEFIEAWQRVTPSHRQTRSPWADIGCDDRFHRWLRHRLPADRLVAGVLADLSDTEIGDLDDTGWTDVIAAAPVLAALRATPASTPDP